MRNGDSKEFYHNEIHAHEDKLTDIPMFKPKVLNIAAKKRKDYRKIHRTRSFKRQNKGRQISAATNAIHISKLLESLHLEKKDEEEHFHRLTIDDIRAIASLNNSTCWHSEISRSIPRLNHIGGTTLRPYIFLYSTLFYFIFII